MLSQFFILSSRGDAIVARDFRHDVSRSSHEVLFRSLKLGTGDDGEVAPVFFQDGVNYFHVKASRPLPVDRPPSPLSPGWRPHLLRHLAREPVTLARL